MSSQIPNYIGATAACVTALATGGMFGSNALLSLLNNISSNIASEPVGHFFYNKLSKIRLFKEDPENLNHDLEKAFIGSVKSAILNLQEAYLKKVRINVSKSQYDNEKNKIDTFFKDWLNEFNEERVMIQKYFRKLLVA